MQIWDSEKIIKLRKEGLSYKELEKLTGRTNNALRKLVHRAGVGRQTKKLPMPTPRPFKYDREKIYDRILQITDTHLPFGHPDNWEFLKLVKKIFKPDLVVHTGDVFDFQAYNRFCVNPDLPGAFGEELQAKKDIEELTKIFPVMYITEGNHDERVSRKTMEAGVSSSFVKSLSEVFEMSDGWQWRDDWTFNTKNSYVHFTHFKSKNCLMASKNMGMSLGQGHYHGVYEIRSWSNPVGMYYGVTAGCLFDKDSVAAAYGKRIMDKPILGCVLWLEGVPQLIPLKLKRGGRWVGKL